MTLPLDEETCQAIQAKHSYTHFEMRHLAYRSSDVSDIVVVDLEPWCPGGIRDLHIAKTSASLILVLVHELPSSTTQASWRQIFKVCIHATDLSVPSGISIMP
jgi:hypothetical protein